MSKRFVGLVLGGACCLLSARSNAQTAALLAVRDASRLSELELAKVMADDSSLWLSAELQGPTRLALVTAEDAVDLAPAADAWLRALDFATRVRVAPPSGPLASCGMTQQFDPSDTGLPEVQRIVAGQVSSATTEVDLRRRLADAGLPTDAEHIARFTGAVRPPFRVAIYDVPATGGSTDAVRLFDQGHSTTLPSIVLSGVNTVSLTVIALSKDGVQLSTQESVDPSEFPVVYRAADASSDYLSARGDWLERNPTRWLNEVQASTPVFAGTVLPSGQRIESVNARYFAGSNKESASACEGRTSAAHERASIDADDFACDGADDLARTLSELGFAEPRASRFFGRLAEDGPSFRIVANGSRSPLLFATDFDHSGCPEEALPPLSTPNTPTTPPATSPAPVVVSASDDPYYGATQVSTTTTVYHEDSCAWSTSSSNSSTHDSCSGDTSTSESSTQSCSGDSSSSQSSSDSCSGDSSNDSNGDSCSGDSSDSKYDGDTCSGSSAESNAGRSKSAALRAEPTRPLRTQRRPRPVRLSLLTLLAAALGLPLRRRCTPR